MTTELAVIPPLPEIVPAQFFKPEGSKEILDSIKSEVRKAAEKLDISTPVGRESIASLAYRVGKDKNALDKAGKDLVASTKAAVKIIDQERSAVWDEMEALQKEVRKPLTDWENAEKERVVRLEASLQELINAGTYTAQNWESLPLDVMQDRLKEVMAGDGVPDWQEFHSRAVAAVTTTVRQIKEAIARREKLESERAELEKLRAEQAKRDQEAREAEIARAATEKAKAQAEHIAQAAAKAAQEAQERVEAEKHAAEARAKQAEAQKAQLEAQAKAQAEAAVQSAARAAKEAAQRQEQAVAAERQRAEDARKAEEAAAEKREANKRHCAKINREVRDALVVQSAADTPNVRIWQPRSRLTPDQAAWLTDIIAAGLIPHTKISY
jgi:colicin import membrane protein